MDLWTVILMNEKNPKDYTRLGGWLLLFLILMILGVLLLFLSIAVTLEECIPYAHLPMAAIAIYMIVLIYMLIKRNKRFRKLYTYGSLLLMVLAILSAISMFSYLQDTAILAQNIVSAVLPSVIWIIYLYRSERVRVYFGYPAKTEPHTDPLVPDNTPDQISAHSDQIAPTTQQPVFPSSDETTLKISRITKYWIAGIVIVCLLFLGGLAIRSALSDAYDSGFNDGFNSALSIGYEQGYSAGEDAGYTTGYTQGKNIGYLNGYHSGEMTGYLNGFDDAVNSYGQYTKTYIDYKLSKMK